MNENTLIKKGLAITVILLFIGVAFAPSINASVVNDDLVEFDVEFCGLGKKHTVQLTQQEGEEIELLFDEIHERLNEVETREEAEEIFKEAVVELNKYGLLGVLSVGRAKKLVTGKFQKQDMINKLESVIDNNLGVFNSNSNMMCLISGKTTETRFFPLTPAIIGLGIVLLTFPIFRVLVLLLEYLYENIDNPILKNIILLIAILHDACVMSIVGSIFLLIGAGIYSPIKLFSPIAFGERHTIWEGNGYTHSASGWIHTIGLKGIKTWDGEFYGNIATIPLNGGLAAWYEFLGAFGFSGLRITTSGETFILGHSLLVNLGSEPPDI